MNSYKQRHVAERNLGDLGQWQRFHPLLCGGSGSASVTANATDAQWTAHSNVNWVTITSGASGTGSGTVAYVVAADSTGAQRVGTVTIAGQTFTVTQPPVSLPNWLITNVPGPANSCPVPAGISTFAPTDAQAVVWFQVSGAQAGDVARVNWIAPNGSIYRTISWNPILSAGSWCMADSMNIVGTAAASMPGQWTASVTWNNYPLFALNFTIGSCSYPIVLPRPAWPRLRAVQIVRFR